MFGDNFDNGSRKPLQKGSLGGVSITDYSFEPDLAYPQTTEIYMTYRTPMNRVNGNDVFRRYLDGTLDIEYAKHKVVDAIHKQKDGVHLTDLEETILTICFPALFQFIDDAVAADLARVVYKVSPEEIARINLEVARHLELEMQYAALPKP